MSLVRPDNGRPGGWQKLCPRRLQDTKLIYNHGMAEQMPGERPKAAGSSQQQGMVNPGADFNIGDEFGTGKRNLPPAGIVLICMAAVALIVGIFAFTERPKPQGTGGIDFVTAAEVPGQNMVLAAITLTLRNTAAKPLWIKSLKAQLTTADGKSSDDEAASAVDVDRYLQAFPDLRESTAAPLSPETKLAPGAEQKGTIIVSFQVTREAFDQRKALTVAIQPYDQPLPVILK